MDYIAHRETPLGRITLASDGERLTGLWFEDQKAYGSTLSEECEEREVPVFTATDRWLDAYFALGQCEAAPPVALRGTVYRRRIWNMLLEIPQGSTVSYGALATLYTERYGERTSARAVGNAVGHNPISLIIPCHRVTGSDGSMTGYAGGTARKEWLLRHEGIEISQGCKRGRRGTEENGKACQSQDVLPSSCACT
ncbi:MAG: methylated-DNA--[Clostridia bacterium]|nr:methylated-DNA--[protein]-cysteine S-methyltransferase [Clostridia bacterium]